MQIPEGAAWIGAQMETLFYFCLRKTSSADEAAELSQDIALAALDALHRGGKNRSYAGVVLADRAESLRTLGRTTAQDQGHRGGIRHHGI